MLAERHATLIRPPLANLQLDERHRLALLHAVTIWCTEHGTLSPVPGPFDTTTRYLVEAYPADWLSFLGFEPDGCVW